MFPENIWGKPTAIQIFTSAVIHSRTMYPSGINVFRYLQFSCIVILRYLKLMLKLPCIVLLNCNYQIDNIFNTANK